VEAQIRIHEQYCTCVAAGVYKEGECGLTILEFELDYKEKTNQLKEITKEG
jgi:hypothetical protein